MVRSKNRYITVKIIPHFTNKNVCDIKIRNNDLYAALNNKVRKIHGDYGVACVKTGLVCQYCNSLTGVAIFKVRHSCYKFISTVIPLMTDIAKHQVYVETLKTSATLQQAYKHLKYYQEKEFERLWNSLDDEVKENARAKLCDLSEINKLIASNKNILSKN